MGDSLIGRTAGFDPVSPGSSPGPPAKSLKISFDEANHKSSIIGIFDTRIIFWSKRLRSNF